MGLLEFNKLPINTLVGADWKTFKAITAGREIDAAYNDFENEAKREEIVAFAQTEEIDPSMLTDFISEYEFSGTMNAGNIRDRIEKPMPLLKKRSLVNRIVDFIRQHTEKYQ